MNEINWKELFNAHTTQYQPIINFKEQPLVVFDLSVNNTMLQQPIFSDTALFSDFINSTLEKNNVVLGVGGYLEKRNIYQRSEVFNDKATPRNIHLGVDIWTKNPLPVYTPLGGVVHSFAYNNNFGDYGATIILQHQLEGYVFHTLYGHLSLSSIEKLEVGKYFAAGEPLAFLGLPHENGNWPPHLHFQIIVDMQEKWGDYPGVCSENEIEFYAKNCPNPNFILQLPQFAKSS